VYQEFCVIADRKKEVFDDELIAIVEQGDGGFVEEYHLEGLHVSTGTALRPTATVELRRAEERLVDSAIGDGPVDAVYKAMERITGMVGKLTEYTLKSVSLGHDAVGEAFVRVMFDGVQFNGRAVSTDVITGSAKAYLEAMNRACAARKRKEEREQQSVIVPHT
jgi:2-isopropylmalate synthase